jgi:hypothetical protein
MKKFDRRSGKFNRPEGFRVREAETALNIREWRILSYVRQNIVPTSVQKADGVKQRRAFSLIDLYQMAVIARLADDGFDLRVKEPFGGIHGYTEFMFRGEYDPENGVDDRAGMEGSWLDRESKDQIIVFDMSKKFFGKVIDRAELGAEIERVLTEEKGDLDLFGRNDDDIRSYYILEIDRLLDLVDRRLPTREPEL